MTPLDGALLAVVCVAVPVLSAVRGRQLARTAPGSLNLIRLYWTIIARSAVLAAFALLAWRLAGRSFTALGLDVPVGPRGRLGLLLDLVFVAYYAAAVFRPKSPAREAAVRARLERLHILPRTSAERALYPLLALVGSTSEELVYRGWLMGCLALVLPLWTTVILSAVAFGVAHVYQGRIGVLRTTIIGLGFGVAYALTQSLWWLMIAHTVFNLSGLVLAYRLLRTAPVTADA